MDDGLAGSGRHDGDRRRTVIAATRAEVTRPLVPMHPEAGASPSEVRWVIPDGLFDVRGVVTDAPGELMGFVERGQLGSIVIAPAAVVMMAAEGVRWPDIGDAVTESLGRALLSPGAWRVAAPQASQASQADAHLVSAVHTVLQGPFGEYVRSHGGSFELIGVSEGVVSIRLRGACSGCPVAEISLQVRFRRELQRLCPGLVSVRAVERDSRFGTRGRAREVR